MKKILSVILAAATLIASLTTGITAFASGSNCALQNLYYKLNSGEPVYIDYIGGSVTQGSGASDPATTSWAALVGKWFDEKFGAGTATNAVIHHKNGGIGATGSFFGSYRLAKYCRFDTAPSDLLFIEFAINDLYDHRNKEQVQRDMESMILQTYQANPYANIILLFTSDFSRRDTDYDAIIWHKEIAEHYQIPYIYLGAPLWKKVVAENGGVTPISASSNIWRKYVTDDVHPNDLGHAFYASLITDYLEYQLLSSDIQRDNSYNKKILPTSTVSDKKTIKLNTNYASFKDAGFTNAVLGDWEFIPETTYITCAKAGGSFQFKFTGTAAAFWCLGYTDGGIFAYTVKRASDKKTVVEGTNTAYIHTALSIPFEMAVGLDYDTYLVEVTIQEGQYGSRGRLCSIMIDGDPNSIQPYSEQTEELLRETAQNYLQNAGNSASLDGLTEVMQKALGAGRVEQFFIDHAINGVYDETTDYPLSIPGHDGYSAAVVSAYGTKVGVVASISHIEENLGNLSTEVYFVGNSNFITNGAGNITGYTGSAEKIVIPANFGKTINWAAGQQNSTVKVMIFGNSDSNMSFTVGTNFKKFTSLYAVQFPKKINGRFAVGALADCSVLRYVKLPHEVNYNGKTTFNNEAFKNCNHLETAYCPDCGKMPEGIYGIGVFANTAIYSYLLPENIGYSSGVIEENVFGVSPSFAVGEVSILNAQKQKKANITRAAALSARAAYEYRMSDQDTAETVLSAITASYNELEGTEKFVASWRGTFQTDGKKASGILTLSGIGAAFSIPYIYDPDFGLSDLRIKGYNITPIFDSEITTYSLTIPYTVEELQIEPRAIYGAQIRSVSGNTGLKVGDNTIIIDTVSLSGKTVNYTITVNRLENKTALNAQVVNAFRVYVENTGNNTNIEGLLEAVNKRITPAVASLTAEEFFIRHAVDGVYDEDLDESTKLSISGHDGYVSAVFRVSENNTVVSIVGAVQGIPYREHNLGILTKSKDEDFVVDDNGDLIDYTGDAEKVIIPSFVRNIVSTGASKNSGLKKAIALVTKNKGNTIEKSAFASAKDGSYGWANLLAADISNNQLIKERAFSRLPSLQYLKLSSNGGGKYYDYAAFADNVKLENVNATSYISLLGNVFYNTAIRDIYEGKGVVRPRKEKYDDYASPSFQEGTRVILTASEQETATFTRAATLAQQAADYLVLEEKDDAESVLDKIAASYRSYNAKITASWNGTFEQNGDTAKGTLTLQYGDGRIEIAFERDNSRAVKELYLTDYTLSPVFDEKHYDYAITVKNSITALSITAITEPGAVLVSIDGNHDFTVGNENIVTLTFRAKNGDLLVYIIQVTRLEPKTFDEIVRDINEAVSAGSLNNDSVQTNLQKLITTAIKGEPFTALVNDFHKYKSIAGATENGKTVLVPGHKGYITGTVLVEGAGTSKNIAVKAVIEPTMEDYTFSSVSSAKDFQLSDDGKTLLTYDGTAEKVVIPEGVEFIDPLYLYADAPGIRCVIFPESLRKLPTSLCYGMTDLEVCYMGDNVVETEAGVFMNCVSLKHVRLSENLPVIGSTMFSHCLSLAQIYIPQSVTQIKSNAFYRSLVREITISQNIERIDENAFSWCVNNATYFSGAGLGAIVAVEQGKAIQSNIVSKWAYKDGVAVPRTITILNDEVEIAAAAFAGDETGAWGINAVRASAGSSAVAFMEHQSDSGSGAPAKKNFKVLNMTAAEAAARAQIAADGIHLLAASTANEAMQTIIASYLSNNVSRAEWLEPYTVSNGKITGKLALYGLNGEVHEVVLNTTVFLPAKPIEKVADKERTNVDYAEAEDKWQEERNQGQNTDNSGEGDYSLFEYDSKSEKPTGEWKTVMKKTRKQMRRPGQMVRYFPVWGWIFIAAGVLVAAGSGTFILLLKRRNKRKAVDR